MNFYAWVHEWINYYLDMQASISAASPENTLKTDADTQDTRPVRNHVHIALDFFPKFDQLENKMR